jgi:RIO kinase 1
MREEKIIKDARSRRIFNDVFDNATVQTIHELARKKYFKEIEFPISTGKEGNVFRCNDGKNFYALKIYKIDTSDFKHMSEYLVGDERFKRIGKDKLEIVKTWTKKEHRNLTDLNRVGVRVPVPITFRRNCLLMEFIGKDGLAAPTAKKKPFKEPKKQYKILCGYMAKMVGKKLVHADLSEYNILNNNEELVIIDAGQAVSTLHPNAKEFFERDVRNLSKWFSKQGVKTDYEKMYSCIKGSKTAKNPV